MFGSNWAGAFLGEAKYTILNQEMYIGTISSYSHAFFFFFLIPASAIGL